MKEKEIAKIVEGRFKTIDRLCHKILKKFDAEDIHDFRVEIKKLRAFLKLCSIKDHEKPLVPDLLKSFYGCTGVIRNIHLHKHTLIKYLTDKNIKIPEEYIALLTGEKDHLISKANKLMKDDSLDNVKEKSLNKLPAKLNKSTIKKFAENKLSDLKHELEDLKDDASIHNVRKILKDLLYDWNYVKDHADLPKAIADEDELKSLTKILGDFIDKSMQLEFFHEDYLGKLKDKNEKTVLLTIKKEWLHQKQIIMHWQIISNLKVLKEQL